MHFKIKEQVNGRRRSEYPMMQNELDESYVDVAAADSASLECEGDQKRSLNASYRDLLGLII